MQTIKFSKASKWFFVIFITFTILSVSTVYYRYLVIKDYEIYMVFTQDDQLVNLYDENDELIELTDENGEYVPLFDQYGNQLPYTVVDGEINFDE